MCLESRTLRPNQANDLIGSTWHINSFYFYTAENMSILLWNLAGDPRKTNYA